GWRERSGAVLLEAGQALGLVLLRECVDEVVDLAVHAPLEVREVVAEAAVRDPVLWEVVGAHLLGALAAADLRTPRRGLERIALLAHPRQEPRAEDRHRLGFVLHLATLVLADHDLASGQVRDPDRGVGRVDALAAVPRRAIDVGL